MELASQQKLVARLCTDRTFREEFFADPQKVAAHSGQTVAAEGLAQLHHEQLRQFARLLRTRRLGEVGVSLPLTRQTLGLRFADSFKNYALQCPPPVGLRTGEDAVGFVRHLEQLAAEHPLEPVWALSLARYEAARVEAEWLGRGLVVRRFPHALKRLLARLAEGSVPEGSFSGLSVAVWWGASSASGPRHWLW